MQFDLDDLTDWIGENKPVIGMIACVLLGAGNLALGGMDKLQAQQATDEKLNKSNSAQIAAETLFKERGCSMQFVNPKHTKPVPVLDEGDIAIDPASGGMFSHGTLLCTLNGAMWNVLETGKVELIGSSPRIRIVLTEKDPVKATRLMAKYFGVNSK